MPSQLADAVVALSRAALRELDLRQHDATHPRLGIVDHISCQPVGPEATLSDAASVAIRIGKLDRCWQLVCCALQALIHVRSLAYKEFVRGAHGKSRSSCRAINNGTEDDGAHV
jgi:Formiminotransferase domain, N-terminal subdomain